MGFISTVASFGIGYAAGMVTGRQGMERLSGRVRGSLSSQDSGDTPMMDVRELRQVMTTPPDAIRTTAEGSDPKTTKVENAYTRDVTALSPTDSVHDAVRMMRSQDVRRLPVVEGGKAVGIVSLGDISVETAPGSLLADISAASPNG